ncbi:MAG: folylpolyglutamate synthase/dihydrofolate synthase family protein [Ignavibacteria bacterium]|nr:folylpolyglutamate synthase/dihydrofolate synthase family protein [Ignavibacteria bacterium]
MNKETALEKLFSLHTLGIKLGLENIVKFLKLLGNPQEKIKCFHVAGSNGKGSTASFIASILKEADYKTGLYTSPHFVNFNERIRINGLEIDDQFVVNFIELHEKYIFENKLTFFEVTTAMAFHYFKEMGVDYAVIETGLGGRLDATNVINPIGVVITSISLEHTNILGDTIELITKEKAAIIKKNCKVFLGYIPESSEKLIEEICDKIDVEIFKLEDNIIVRENFVELYNEELNIDKLNSPLRGYYQRYNAVLAALTVYKCLDIHNEKIIEKGIQNVVVNTGLSGRYEIAKNRPLIILDSAHNLEGISNFLNEFRLEENKYIKKSLLFTAMRDKLVFQMLVLLNSHFDTIYVTELTFERGLKIKELQELAEESDIKVTPVQIKEFLKEYLSKNAKDECLVITGSMYLLGEVKKILPELTP